MELTSKQIYKAVANYLANDLGIDKEYINAIIKQQLEKTDIAAIARRELNQCMLQTTRDGFNAAAIIRRHVDQVIDEELLARMKSGEMSQICQNPQPELTLVHKEPDRFNMVKKAEIWAQNYLLCVIRIANTYTISIDWVNTAEKNNDAVWKLIQKYISEEA